MADGVDLLVGTTKGLFILSDTGGRGGWQVTGPFCDGMGINHVLGEGGSGTIWAAGGGGWFPAGVWRCQGGAWSLATQGFDENVQSVWSVARDGDRLLAGTRPAALYESRDGGES